MNPALRTILLLTTSLIILILAGIGIFSVLDIGSAVEIRDALWKALGVIVIVGLASAGLSLLLGGKKSATGNDQQPKV